MPDLLVRISTHLLLPILFSIWLAHTSGNSRLGWAIEFVVFWSYIVLVFLSGNWPLLVYPARYLPPVVLLVGSVWGVRRWRSLQARPSGWGRPLAMGLLGVSLAFTAIQAVLAQRPGEDTITLQFPLRNGTYCTLEGGRHPLVNRYAAIDSIRTAVELARLGSGGRVETAESPTLYSPVEGLVTDLSAESISLAVRGRDLKQGDTDGLVVKMWPIEDPRVEIGQSVAVGANLGRVGTGLNQISSLVLVAHRGERPTPVNFSGYYLPRNALYRAPRDSAATGKR